MSRTRNQIIENATVVGIKDFTGYTTAPEDTVHLTVGTPSIQMDPSIVEVAIEALRSESAHYPPALGNLEARTAVCEYEKRVHNLEYDPREVLITQGSTEALACAMYSLVNPGDEIIVPTPYYPVYQTLIEMQGGIIVPIDTTANDFKLTPHALEAAMSDKTKIVLLTTPNNPTGTIYSRHELDALSAVICAHDCYVISDEVYAQIIFKEYASFGHSHALRDRLIIIRSFSKVYAMTGWRLGYMLAPHSLIEVFVKWHHNVITGVTSFIQPAIVPALALDVTPIVEQYKEHRDYMYKRLVEMGLDVVEPDGAFYMFPSIEKFGVDSTTFCTNLVHQAGVMLVPGKAFGSDKHVRLSYCYDIHTIEEAMNRMAQYIKSL